MAGWIKLYRSIQSHWIWSDKPFSKGQAWIDMLLMANHEDKKIVFDNSIVWVKRGSFITSIRKLSERWGWSNTKIKNFLNLLQSDGMISYFSDAKKTVITIENYSLYQDLNDAKTTEKRQTNDTETTQKHTNKNIKNEKEYKEVVVVVDNSQQQLKKIFEVFEQNIHPPTPLEIKKLESWLEDVEADVVIMAIEEAVKNNVRKLSYIEKILKTWVAQGLKTKADVEAYRRDWQDRKAGSETQPINQPIKTLTEQLKEKYGNLLAGDSG